MEERNNEINPKEIARSIAALRDMSDSEAYSVIVRTLENGIAGSNFLSSARTAGRTTEGSIFVLIAMTRPRGTDCAAGNSKHPQSWAGRQDLRVGLPEQRQRP